VTPNIFTTSISYSDEAKPPKWQPVDTFKVTLESGERLMLQKHTGIIEIADNLHAKAEAFTAYHAPTNTIYYYVSKDKKRGQPKG
jgi:hypothetical protein